MTVESLDPPLRQGAALSGTFALRRGAGVTRAALGRYGLIAGVLAL